MILATREFFVLIVILLIKEHQILNVDNVQMKLGIF